MKHNPTCLVTGKKDNLQMFPLRDDNGNMIGWIFVSDSINMEQINAEVKWTIRAKVKGMPEVSPTNTDTHNG